MPTDEKRTTEDLAVQLELHAKWHTSANQWFKPEDTAEWQAAARLRELEAENARLRAQRRNGMERAWISGWSNGWQTEISPDDKTRPPYNLRKLCLDALEAELDAE